MAKVKAKPFLSEKGELVYVFIDGEGRKDLNGNNRFTAALRLSDDSEELKRMKKLVTDYWKDHKPKGASLKSNGIKKEIEYLKDDNGEVLLDEDGKKQFKYTGYHLIQFWTGTKFEDGSPKKVQIFNKNGDEVDLKGKKIGNGSRGWISGAMQVYDNGPGAQGVTLFLNAIQLAKFVEFEGSVILATPDDLDEDDDFVGIDDSGVEQGEAEEKPKLKL